MVQLLTKPSVSRYILAAGLLLAGLLHFIKPEPFAHIIPDFFPRHKLLVFVSGAAEWAGAVGILIPKMQWWAGWGLILLLIAVFPANLNMSVQAVRHQGIQSWYTWGSLVRLPLQFVLIYWVYWACILEA